MTALPAANYISNAARTQGEGKTALEAIVSFLRERLGSGGAVTSVASAATVDLGAQTSRLLLITGTTTITSFGTTNAGDNAVYSVRFGGVLTLTNGSNLILPTGANITTAAGDTCLVVWESTNVWRVIVYQRANGQALASTSPIFLQTSTATTSNTAFDYTSIPSTVKRITIVINGISNAGGTGALTVQIGSGSVDTSGYTSAAAIVPGTNQSGVLSISNGFALTTAMAAATIVGGVVTLVHQGSNVWGLSANLGTSGGAYMAGGYKSLSGALDRLRLTWHNGTDTFDAGSFNIMWES